MFKKAFASFLAFVFVCFGLSTFFGWFFFNSARNFNYEDELFVNAFADFFADATVTVMLEQKDIPLTDGDYRTVIAESLDVGLVKKLMIDFERKTFQEPINDRTWSLKFIVDDLFFGEKGLMLGVADRVYEQLAVCERTVENPGLYECRTDELSEEDFRDLVVNDLRRREFFSDLAVDVQLPLKVSGSLGAFLVSAFNSFLLFSGICLFLMLTGVALLTMESPLRSGRWVSVSLLVSSALASLFTLAIGRLPDMFNVASRAEDFPLNFEQSQLVFQFLNLSVGDFAAGILPYLAGFAFFCLVVTVGLSVLIRRYDI